MDVLNKLKNHFYYSIESMKNRFPCRIIRVKNATDFKQETTIIFQAVTKINIREQRLRDITDDPLLIEKFHPTDCIKIGFLCAGDILFEAGMTLDKAKALYKNIVNEMFNVEKEDDNESQ